MNIILLSGGAGKRLWPLSNEARYKQFLRLLDDENGGRESMLQRVYRQLKQAGLASYVVIAASAAQRDSIRDQLGDQVDLVLEPERRDTYPAIALASAFLKAERGCSLSDVAVVLPVDFYVNMEYFRALKKIEKISQAGAADIVLMGIEPSVATSKYGYILPGEKYRDYELVQQFIEKPEEDMAKRLIQQGAVWNGGVFAFRLAYLEQLLQARGLPMDDRILYAQYSTLPKISFDYEVVEKARSVAFVRYHGDWSDLGTWNTLTNKISAPVMGKAVVGESTERTHVLNETQIPMVVLGAKDMVVVASQDGILVSGKEESANLRGYPNQAAMLPTMGPDGPGPCGKPIPVSEPVLEGNETAYVMEALRSTWISSTGRFITELERKFACYCGTSGAAAVSNGTVALHLALAALGIGPGDEVIVPDLTFAATINAVLYTGATPVIVDIDPDSWCISPEAVVRAITPRTRVIIPVHLYGQPCDMERICGIAREYGLKVVEDCAEAHGARFQGRRVGSFGDIGCFSFYGNKIMTTGEGGMCVTNDSALEERMRVLRDHGMRRERRYYHEMVGFNYRMTNMQAAVGVAQLEKIEDLLAWRSALEEKYHARLSQIPGIRMQRNDLPNRCKVNWLVSVLLEKDRRDRCIQCLKKAGFETRPFFHPLSEMRLYRPYATHCEQSLRIAPMGVNLPTVKRLTDENIDEIAQILARCCAVEAV